MSGLQDWLLDKVGGNNYLYIKRLSANDTGATGGHQVGIYIPSGIVAELFPSIDHTSEKNPSVLLRATYSSHECVDSEVRAIYYNNKYFGQTRNEKRITRWGGLAVPYRIRKIQVLCLCLRLNMSQGETAKVLMYGFV